MLGRSGRTPEGPKDSGAGPNAPASNFIRGQAFHSLSAAAAQILRRSPEELSAFVEEPLRGALRYRAVVRNGWFPIDWYADLHQSIARLNRSGRPVSALHRRLGALSCEEDIRGVYRFILGLSSPGFVVGNLGRILGSFVKSSEFRVIESTPEGAHLLITMSGASPEIWEDIAGGAEVVLSTSGAKNPRVTLESRAPSQIELRARWNVRE